MDALGLSVVVVSVLHIGDVSDHLLAYRGVRQGSLERGHVVGQMVDFGGGGNRASDGGMRNDKFEKELRPTGAVNFLGPGRQRLAAHFAKQPAFGEGPVH